MRIKRTYGATMREALAQVKLEQGVDAVILGNKKVPGGVEIISAVDFDHRQVDAYAGNPSLPLAAVAGQAESEGRVAQSTQYPAIPAPTVPDFLYDQTTSVRKEPVLGVDMGATPSPGKQPAAASTTPQNQGSATITRPDFQRKSRVPEPSLPVEEEALLRAHRAEHDQEQLAEQRTKAVFGNASDSQSIDAVKDELKNLRELMKSQLNVLEWERYSERHPVRSVLLNLMNELGLGADICELLFKHLGDFGEDPHKLWQQAMGLLARGLPIGKDDILAQGGRIALVGSTGVGKTTTIAKLAARYAHTHGKRSVALISADSFRIGAQDQLQHFARMLEIPLLSAGNAEELSDRLRMLSDKSLVLIDTAGMSQTDVRLYEQFNKLKKGAPEIKPYLVLSANTQLAALNDTVKCFARARPAGVIVTKIDESASLGGILTTSIRYRLPLVYCSEGQRVPEDLQQAKKHRLVSKAVSLMQKSTERSDKELLAFRYNHLITSD